MARAETLTLPTEIEVDPDRMEVRMTPNELRLLKQQTGRNLNDLLGENADDADRLQMTVWLKVRRDGIDADWDACGDIAIVFASEAAPDPLNGSSSTE
jgi:hypothetical protein